MVMKISVDTKHTKYTAGHWGDNYSDRLCIFFLVGGLPKFAPWSSFLSFAPLNFSISRTSAAKITYVFNISKPAITLRITRFNVQKFYVVLTLHLYIVYWFQEKTVTLPYTTTDWFCLTEVESVHCVVLTKSLCKTGTRHLWRVNF